MSVSITEKQMRNLVNKIEHLKKVMDLLFLAIEKKKIRTLSKEKKIKWKQKIWKNALKVIPGGNGLISKRPERFLPGLWPTYYKFSNGINKGLMEEAFAQMGFGTSTLGYKENT